MTAATVSAIVVVHGSPAEIVDRCVRSLLDSTDVDVRVVLVDNASPDGGVACEPWRDHKRVTVVSSERNDGFAAGVNQGLARRRQGDRVFLLNDDATVAVDTIARCVATLDSHDGAISVAPRVMLADEPDLIDSIGVVIRPNGEAFNAYIGQPWSDQVVDGDTILGPCFSAVLFREDAFDDDVVGVLDERYRLYYEDIDWALRAVRNGYTCVASTGAVVHHQHAASTRLLGEASRYELVQRNLLLCATKNFGWRSVARIWGGRLVVHAKGVVTGPYRWERVRSIARAVVHAPGFLASRRDLSRDRTRTDEELFAHADGMTPLFDAETYRSMDDR